jgi:predicted AAA+ superfamily ATPase
MKKEIDSRFSESFAMLSKLNLYFQDYLLTGGIPKVIDEYLKNGRIGSSKYNIYLQSIIGDMHSLDADENIFKRLIKYVIEKIHYPFSYRDIQKNIDVGSPNTIERYINLLCNMFILTTYYHYDSTHKEKRSDKPKKIGFHDPFFFHVLNSWIRPEDAFNTSQSFLSDKHNQGFLVESIIGDHLIRLAFHLVKKKQMFDYSNYLFYWQDKHRYEVDYILYDGDEILVPIEVKYTNGDIKKEDINGLINFKKITGKKNAIVITKDKFNIKDEYVEIPASIFLLLI